MSERYDEKKDRFVGLKVPNWKREALKEVARRERTDVSGLLRDGIDDALDEYDVEELLESRGYDESDQQELEA